MPSKSGAPQSLRQQHFLSSKWRCECLVKTISNENESLDLKDRLAFVTTILAWTGFHCVVRLSQNFATCDSTIKTKAIQ
jgi:hypothetical protein